MSETIDGDDLETQVRELTEQLPPLTVQIRESNERAAQARRLGLWHVCISVMLGLVAVGVVVGGYVISQKIDRSINQFRDCVVATGKCAQAGAQISEISDDSLTYRNELQRLETELPISEAKGDQIRVDESKKRIAELQAMIVESNNRITAIRQQFK